MLTHVTVLHFAKTAVFRGGGGPAALTWLNW